MMVDLALTNLGRNDNFIRKRRTKGAQRAEVAFNSRLSYPYWSGSLSPFVHLLCGTSIAGG